MLKFLAIPRKNSFINKHKGDTIMALSLKDLLKYSDIVIQCHDNPDADALASGYALQWYFKQMGKDVPFVYGGRAPVTKSNLLLMIEHLEIDVRYVTEIRKPELLVTVDCQYGESNVTRFEAENVAIIDHHQVRGNVPEFAEIRSNYGSCSTILYEMLKDEGFDINRIPGSDEKPKHTKLATALYYGLMTDTGGFAEVSHPADRDLRDLAKFSPIDITLFRNSNYSREELDIAAKALKNATYNMRYEYGVIQSPPCDPNILGLVGDMFMEVDCIGTCLVYCILSGGVKFSVRSCVKETKANELAEFIADGYGGGGGHLEKAGGFLRRELLEAAGIEMDMLEIFEFMQSSMTRYFTESTVIVAGEHKEDLSLCSVYRKNSVNVGFVTATDIAPVNTKIQIRTLEGDIEREIEEDDIIIIGVDGEIYPIRKSKFESSYTINDTPYKYPGPTDYPPLVINRGTCEQIPLLPLARSATATGGICIYARELEKRYKVFTAWDRDNYYLGKKGDFLAVREDDLSDFYIIERSIFEKTYTPVKN